MLTLSAVPTGPSRRSLPEAVMLITPAANLVASEVATANQIRGRPLAFTLSLQYSGTTTYVG